MNVETLIEVLQQVKDKKLLVRLDMPKDNTDKIISNLHGRIFSKDDDYPNYWLHSIFVHNKGDSGYEQNGEVTLWGEE
tara:strand:+ start:441 stop:674 length:234 start_codon:yes stop_codon:yes gene_type:complete